MPIEVGQYASITREFTAEDIAEYGQLCCHQWDDALVPEPLLGALFSYLLGVKLPGVGTNYLKQDTQFHYLPKAGDQLTASVEITQVRREKHLVDLNTVCVNQAGDTVCEGRALVYIRDVAQ